MTQKIKIIPDDERLDVIAWIEKANAAERSAEQHYRVAVITGNNESKIAFFDDMQRAREIRLAIDRYWHG